jgi:hypothetical protein
LIQIIDYAEVKSSIVVNLDRSTNLSSSSSSPPQQADIGSSRLLQATETSL